MAKIGDIVSRTDTNGVTRRYTVHEFVNNAHGGRDAVLRAKFSDANMPTRYHRWQRDEALLVVDESPVFEVGEKVLLGDRKGVVLEDSGSDTVLVNLQAEEKDLADGVKVDVDAITQPVPRDLLVLDNRLP